jgi:hypothetical protein
MLPVRIQRHEDEEEWMSEWMRTLAGHYEYINHTYPHDRLIILFDISQ